jgi:hypothetical protein
MTNPTPEWGPRFRENLLVHLGAGAWMCAGANVIERVGAFEEVGHANRLAISGIANEIGHADRRLPSYIGNLANAPTVTDMINPDHIPGSMPVTYFLCRRTGDVGSCQHPC